MPKFRYVATAADGSTVKGVEEADTVTGVKTALFDRDLRVVELKEKKSLLKLELTKRKLPREEVMHFSRQLAAFIRAGVPILDALEVIGEESSNAELRDMLRHIREALTAGAPLSDAVDVHKRVLPPFYVDMLRSAELTGRLDYVLDQLSRYIERDLDAKRKVRSALAYPTVIFAMSLVTIGILTIFVLPRFKKFFESLNAKLPLPTRILLNFSDFLGNWWWAVIATVFMLVGGVYLIIKRPRGREAKDKLLLKLPVVGEVIRYAIVERFCRVLASMVNAGVPLPDAMTVVGDGAGNVVYTKAIADVREAMMEGEGLSRPIARTRLFPASVTQMMRVGEDTGTLDDQLEAAAVFYDQELDYKIKRLTTLFEPAVIVFMGLVVGFVAIALISAMYGIFRQAGNITG